MNATCPDCGKPLYFSGDGRFGLCERCGYQVPVEGSHGPNLQELEALQQNRRQYKHLDDDSHHSPARLYLTQGVAAVKQNQVDEAVYELSFVLRTRSTDEERGEAWYWLSQLFADPEEKRVCLEHALALVPQLGPAQRALAVLEGRLSPEEIINPNTVHDERTAETETAVSQKFACPQCDAGMRFDAAQELLHCAFCGLTQTVAEQAAAVGEKNGRFGQGAFEQDFVAALSTAKGHLQPINLRVLTCQSCTTEFMLAPEMVSVTCPYCESVFVTDIAESADIMPPHAMLPFRLPESKAAQIRRRWLKEHRVPVTNLPPLHGVYQPVWTFDMGGEVTWRGEVKRNDSYVPVSGSRLLFFDDVLVPGGKQVTRQLVQAITSFELSQLEPYDARYLASWPAERYTLPLADASLQGRSRVLKKLRKRPQEVARYHETVYNIRLNFSGLVVESFKLLLLPLWIGHYQADGQPYELLINGQTGEVVGERPLRGLGKLVGWLKGS